MHASSVVAIFYLAAGIAPSFAAPMLVTSDLAKFDPFKTASTSSNAETANEDFGSARTSSDSTSSHYGSTSSNYGSTSSNYDSTSSDYDSTSSDSEEEYTAKPANKGTGGTTTTPETTTPTNENPASPSTSDKWRLPLELSEQAAQQISSGLVTSGLILTDTNLTHRDVLERFEAQIDHELAARAHQYRREPLTMLLTDLD